MEETTLYDYSTPIHRVLLEPGQMFGIGLTPAILILVITTVFMSMVSFWCFPIGLAALVACRFICKNDPYALTILFERLSQPTVYRSL